MNPYINSIKAFLILLFLLFAFSGHSQKIKSESQFKEYFAGRSDSLDQLEGIWEVKTIQQFYRYDTLYDMVKTKASKIVILNNGDHFDSINLDGQAIEVQFSPSDVAGVYMYKNYYKETDSYSKASAAISKNGRMEFSYEYPEKYL